MKVRIIFCYKPASTRKAGCYFKVGLAGKS
jgi:hypothetical protein